MNLMRDDWYDEWMSRDATKPVARIDEEHEGAAFSVIHTLSSDGKERP